MALTPLLGVGAVVKAVPPVAFVPYQRKVFVPVGVAASGAVGAPAQYTTGDVMAGATGAALTTTLNAVDKLSHPLTVCVTA